MSSDIRLITPPSQDIYDNDKTKILLLNVSMSDLTKVIDLAWSRKLNLDIYLCHTTDTDWINGILARMDKVLASDVQEYTENIINHRHFVKYQHYKELLNELSTQ